MRVVYSWGFVGEIRGRLACPVCGGVKMELGVNILVR